jgi:hypothetical protein
MIFQILIVFLVLNTSMIKSSSISFLKIDCVNPPETQLNELYADAYVQYSKQQIATRFAVYHDGEINKQQLASSSVRSNVYYHNGHRVCDINKQTKWDMNYNALCPHHFVVELREDRYPFNRTRAVCNCENCLGLPDSGFITYGCLPTMIPQPVLVRGKCMSNGFYEWTPKYELVAIGCKCDLPIKMS